jgi:radical SAM protein with 4Fe4S-binding SPASM domain
MQILYQTVKPFDQLLKKQKVKLGQKYRPMYYVVEQPVDEGLLLYHTMTKALLLLTPEEAKVYKEHPADLPQLIELWFLVPQSHDDRLLSRQIRDVAKMLENESNAIISYTILTTTDCNARCFYCYEMGRSRIPMSHDTALQTADYIINHCQGKNVILQWLGGEPLYNKPVITLICQRLKDAGIKYTSKITSNGYLFDEDTVKEAKDLWKLDRVQITLDGTEKIYNRSKAYIYKDVNAYRTVIKNIHHLQKANIVVRLRLNIDIHNADNLLVLAEELHQEFSNTKGIDVYMHTLFEESKGSKSMGDNQKRAFIFEKMKEINVRLSSYGFVKPARLDRVIKKYACQADNDQCIIIMPSGQIGKCEHYTDNFFVGHINQKVYDQEMIGQFKELREEIEKCLTCPIYPTCMVLKLCIPNKHCYEEMQEKSIHGIRQAMCNAYLQFKNSIQNETND